MLTCGFYNSVNDDRRYNSEQISALFDGLIRDGVFSSVGEALNVTSSSGMTILVHEGRAWFNHTWTNNDAELPLTVTPAEVVLNRVDAVVLEINSNTDVRANTVKIIKGTPATVPVAPTIVRTTKINQYPLANIYVGAGITAISQENITNKIGSTDCPLVTGILQQMTIDALVAQWDNEFDTWFTYIKDLFGSDPVGALQAEIDALESGKSAQGDITTQAGLDDYSLPSGIYSVYNIPAGGYSGLPSSAFTLLVGNDYGNYATQMALMYGPEANAPRAFMRKYRAGTYVWSDWVEIYTTGTKPTPADIGAETPAGAQAKVDVLRQWAPVLTTGTSAALVVTSAGLALYEGTTLRVKLHTNIGPGATININSIGAKAILNNDGTPVKAGAVSGSYLTLVYNGTSFILQGEGGGGSKATYGNRVKQISTFELFMHEFTPNYTKGGFY